MVNVHLRNPWEYMHLVRDVRHPYISWDYGSPIIRRINPLHYAKLRYGAGFDFTAYSVAVEGMAEYNQDSRDLDSPAAVYPTWHWRHGWEQLQYYCDYPVGENPKVYNNESIPKEFRPVKGQPHRILIYDFPRSITAEGRDFFLRLIKIQEDYPNIDFVAHGTTSFRYMFLARFEAVLYNPHWMGKLNAVQLPNGLKVPHAAENRHLLAPWANALGIRVTDLVDEDGLTEFNTLSILWAGKHYLEDEKFKVANVDRIVSDGLPDNSEQVNLSRASIFMGRVRRPQAASLMPGDGVICNTCSLASKCRLFREGAVCGVPSTDSAKLAKLMGSRDADQLIEGLSEIAKVQAARVGKDLEEEEDSGKRFPETDKRLKDLFDSGQKIARLVKPELNGRGVQVNVGVMGGTAIVQQRTPQELVSGAIRALEDKGIPRERITEDAILGLLEGVTSRKGTDLLEEVIDAELVE